MNQYKKGYVWGLAAGVFSMLLTVAVAYGADGQPAPAPSSDANPGVPSTTTPPPASPSVPTTGRPVRKGKKARMDRKKPQQGTQETSKMLPQGQPDREQVQNEQAAREAKQQLDSNVQK